MYAALKNEKDKDMRTDYLLEAKRLGIKVLLPHVNESDIDFTIDGDALRFGLSSIKYVSDLIASRYIAKRPFGSYKEVEDFTFSTGSGVNSRALEYMRKIGAVAFPGAQVDQEVIRENLYEVLNLPEFTTELPEVFYEKMIDLEEYDEGDVAMVFAMTRNIKRGKGWSRVEFVDRTGTASAFDKERTDVESGRVYLMLLSDNRIFKAIPAAEATDMKHGLTRYLSMRDIPLDGGEYYVVALKARTTKAGKKMADMILANNRGELAKVVCFSKEFPSLYMKVKEGYAYKMVLGATKDGSIVYRGLA
jgi:DNA polymerase-3 subunit alpha